MTFEQIIWRKVTPEVVQAIHDLSVAGVAKPVMARQLHVSADTIKRIRNGRYHCDCAATMALCKELFVSKAQAQAGEAGGKQPLNTLGNTSAAPEPQKRTEGPSAPQPSKLAPASDQQAGAGPFTQTNEPEKDDSMLLVNAGLRPETRQHFKLPRNPFVDDVQSPDDVFQTPSVRYIRAALTDCALHHGFMAVVGESGAGKSTLAEDLQERIRTEGRDILLIKPYVLGMESTDDRGKTLKSTQIAEAIAYAIDPQVKLRLSSEARFRQVHQLLVASRRSGHRHLLVIEEAHCLPIATLKHLKRFLELKDGMQRLIGIALIGQPELRSRLSGQNAEVREVAQRCEIVELEPLDSELEGYLQHKFARFDLKLSDVFTPDAFDAMRARLIHRPRGGKPTDARSLCFPLVVNNLVCRAMNAAASAHWPQVDAQVIGGC